MVIIIKGQVVGKIQGFYEVEGVDKKIYTLKLKGILKRGNNKLNCVIGDLVEFDKNDEVITKVEDRRNLLLRPLIANIDNVAITACIKYPDFDMTAFQKNLLWVDKQEIETILILNKMDMPSKEEKEEFFTELRSILPNIKVFEISVKTGLGISELEDYLMGKTIVLSGVSGVGKSSLVNRLMGDEFLEVGEISKKTKKGKNTTIVTRYFEKGDIKIFDTPGYSSVVDPLYEEKREVMMWFPEIRELLGNCKFNDCIHLEEPGCYVKEKMNEKRYEFYTSVIERNKNERH